MLIIAANCNLKLLFSGHNAIILCREYTRPLPFPLVGMVLYLVELCIVVNASRDPTKAKRPTDQVGQVKLPSFRLHRDIPFANFYLLNIKVVCYHNKLLYFEHCKGRYT